MLYFFGGTENRIKKLEKRKWSKQFVYDFLLGKLKVDREEEVENGCSQRENERGRKGSLTVTTGREGRGIRAREAARIILRLLFRPRPDQDEGKEGGRQNAKREGGRPAERGGQIGVRQGWTEI